MMTNWFFNTVWPFEQLASVSDCQCFQSFVVKIIPNWNILIYPNNNMFNESIELPRHIFPFRWLVNQLIQAGEQDEIATQHQKAQWYVHPLIPWKPWVHSAGKESSVVSYTCLATWFQCGEGDVRSECSSLPGAACGCSVCWANPNNRFPDMITSKNLRIYILYGSSKHYNISSSGCTFQCKLGKKD